MKTGEAIRSKWVTHRLESFAKIYSGKDYKGNPKGDEYPIYGTGGVMGHTGAMLNSGPAVLTGRKGTIDRPEFVEGDFWHVDTVFCIKPDETVDCKLLYYLFASRNLSYLNEATGVPSVSSSALYRLRFSAPSSTDEQRRIAEILSTCDEVITRSRAVVEKLRKIKAGMLNDFFTRGIGTDGQLRPTLQQAPKLYKDSTPGPVPKEWEVKRVGDVCDTSSGGTPSRSVPAYYRGTIKWFTTSELKDCDLFDSDEHISEDALKNSSAKLFCPGTILMAMYGATIGKLGVLRVEAASNQACCAISCKQISPAFLYNQLLHLRTVIIDKGCGAGQSNISQEIVGNLEIVCPTPTEQDRIAERLAAMDERIVAEERVIAKYRSVKAGLMQRLLAPPAGAEVAENVSV